MIGVLLSLLAASHGYYASSVDGGVLANECAKNSGLEFDSCTGFIMGVSDALSFDNTLCPTGQMPTAQIIAIVRKRLRDHPEEWSKAAVWIVQDALKPMGCPWTAYSKGEH